MNLHLLRLFVAVAEADSFSRAAEALWISQPAVSKGLRELEHQLGLVLIERGSSRAPRQQGEPALRLSEAGAALLVHARSIFALERAAMEDVKARVGLQRGSLTLGASTTVANYWLPPYVAAFCRGFPGVVPRVMVGNTTEICEKLLDCEIDLALVEGRVDHERIEVVPWKDDALVVVVPPGSDLLKRRVTPAMLGAQSWLLREPGSGTRQVTEALCATHGITATPWMEMASNEAIARTVAAGVGISMLPKAVVSELVAVGKLVELQLTGALQSLSRPLFRLSLKGRAATHAAQKMIELLHGAAAATPGGPIETLSPDSGP